MTILRRLRQWFLLFFVVKDGATPAPQKQQRESRRPRPESYGSLYFRDDILDRLGDYFSDLRLMRQHDPAAYNLYRQIGGQVITSAVLVPQAGLEPAWLATRPSFGFISFANSGINDDSRIWLSAIYYQKTKRIAGVQATRQTADMYSVTVCYVDRLSAPQHTPFISEFFVAVDQDGSVRPLRERYVMNGPIPTRLWGGSRVLKLIADDNNLSTDDAARSLFLHVANTTASARAGIQVRAFKGHLCATFNIDMLRTPYFFADRDKEKGASGHTKKIFHIVRAHERFSQSGQRSVVKTHFRGLRRFKWIDYKVVVSVPGLHHPDIKEFAATGIAIEKDDVMPQDMLTAPEVGRRLSEAMMS